MNVRVAISEQRFRPYLLAANQDETRALALCLWNIRLSEAFYPSIHAMEVSLRNHILPPLRKVYGDQWWLSGPFESDLGSGAERLEEAITKAERKVAKSRRPVSEGDLAAELSFGFWARMLDGRHQIKIWSRHFPKSFPYVPAQVGRSGLKKRLEEAVDLRNRIFHHEPIFKKDTSGIHARLMEALAWISPSKADWIGPHCRLPEIVRQRPA